MATQPPDTGTSSLFTVLGAVLRPTDEAAAQHKTDFLQLLRQSAPGGEAPKQPGPITEPPPDTSMTTNTINAALDAVAKFEGGYVNDPADPGGETNKGVTLRVLQEVQPGATSADLKKLTSEAARRIFYTRYVDQPGLDKLPDVIQAEAIGLSINAGPDRAIKVLQKAAGVEPDGKLGPATLTAVKKLDNAAVKEAVDNFYIHLVEQKPQLKKFLKGWLNRSAGLNAIPEDKQ